MKDVRRADRLPEDLSGEGLEARAVGRAKVAAAAGAIPTARAKEPDDSVAEEKNVSAQ